MAFYKAATPTMQLNAEALYRTNSYPNSTNVTMPTSKPHSKQHDPVLKFADNTSIHGIKYIFGTDSDHNRPFWILIVIPLVGFLVWQVYVTMAAYYQFSVKTTVAYEAGDARISLPAITFCNPNGFKRRAVGGLRSLYTPLMIRLGIRDPNDMKSACDATEETDYADIIQLLISALNSVMPGGPCFAAVAAKANGSSKSIQLPDAQLVRYMITAKSSDAENLSETAMETLFAMLNVMVQTPSNGTQITRAILPELIRSNAFTKLQLQQALANTLIQGIIKSGDGTAASIWQLIGLTGFQVFGHNAKESVLECRWQQTPMDCSRQFLNHMTDKGWCFTWNPSPEMVDGYTLLEDLLATQQCAAFASAYGTSSTEVAKLDFSIASSGARTSVDFVLNALADDYCTGGEQQSTGFTALVHNADFTPVIFLSNPLDLPPGFVSNVAISMQETTRNTADQGYCTNTFPLSFYPNISAYYKDACIVQCFTELINANCSCLPYYAPPRSWIIAEKRQPTDNAATPCFSAPLITCQAKIEREILVEGVSTVCRQCKRPCHEVKYNTRVSTSYYPADNLHATLTQKYRLNQNWSTETLRKNLLLASFYVDAMEYERITEDLSMTWNDLLNSLGGALGLMLGSSLISIFEILCFAYEQIAHSARRRRAQTQRRNRLYSVVTPTPTPVV